MKTRIVKEGNGFYPEYFHKSFFGKRFDRWERFKEPGAVNVDMLYGVVHDDEVEVVRYTLEEAKEYLEPKNKQIINHCCE